jgi:trigger factor
MTIDASRLEISVEDQERWRRRMSVTVPSSLVQEEHEKAARTLASRMKLKGFRKGKVPTRVVEERFGPALRRETVDRVIREAYQEALSSRELRPISEGELEEVVYEPEAGSDLIFSITFDVEPAIQLDRLSGFVVERPVATVEPRHVDEVLDRIREQNGAWMPDDEGRPIDKDLVSVRIRRVDGDGEEAGEEDEGKEYEFVLGQGDAIPDVEEAIKELEVGESRQVTVSFPEDFPAEERRGVEEEVEITLLGRKVRELPELDDDLARQVGEFETLEELRERIREDLTADAEQQAESVVRRRLLDLVVDANPFQVPRSMVDRYVDSVLEAQLQGQADQIPEERLDELRAEVRPQAEPAVKRILVIEQIARSRDLAAGDDDLDERIEVIAEKNDSTPAQVYAGLQKSGRLEQLEREITEQKVIDFLKDQSEITDAPAA